MYLIVAATRQPQNVSQKRKALHDISKYLDGLETD